MNGAANARHLGGEAWLMMSFAKSRSCPLRARGRHLQLPGLAARAAEHWLMPKVSNFATKIYATWLRVCAVMSSASSASVASCNGVSCSTRD